MELEPTVRPVWIPPYVPTVCEHCGANVISVELLPSSEGARAWCYRCGDSVYTPLPTPMMPHIVPKKRVKPRKTLVEKSYGVGECLHCGKRFIRKSAPQTYCCVRCREIATGTLPRTKRVMGMVGRKSVTMWDSIKEMVDGTD